MSSMSTDAKLRVIRLYYIILCLKYLQTKAVKQVEESTQTLDPAMIGVLVGMALMFVIICVVLRLFSR